MFCKMGKKIKVVWICHFSDLKIRAKLKYSFFSFLGVLMFLLKKPYRNRDFSIWITNAIKEFEKKEDIDLTIIFPHYGVIRGMQEFNLGHINYCCYKQEEDRVIPFLKYHFCKGYHPTYAGSRFLVRKKIEEIKPDIVHVIGAENPCYGLAALDIPQNIPIILSLQTLLCGSDFEKNYPIEKKQLEYKKNVEQKLILRSDFIGTRVGLYREIIVKEIKPDAVFLDITLAVGEDVCVDVCDNKKYDFVYFAANISKAADDAIEAFAIALSKHPNITLNISGAYSQEYKSLLSKRIAELNISKSVFFTGPQATHGDVLNQIKKSKFAILPLKVDMLSGTIREAMACGLPVVTTITPYTPGLNNNRQCVLLSEKGDYQTMANNMLLLLNDERKAEELRDNALLTIQEKYSNKAFMEEWHNAYCEIYSRINR